jgi:hypothetical protein
MTGVTYKIKAGSPADLRQRRVIVRSFDPDDIEHQLSATNPDQVDYVQLLSPAMETDKIDKISRWPNEVPIDIYLSDPKVEFPLLYNFSKLAGRHPIRATIAAKPGLFKGVKLALALNFAVKLDIDEPDEETVQEMAEVVELYLHQQMVSQPVEFFHSIFLAFYRNEQADLWSIQEDDPHRFRTLSDDGVEIPGLIKHDDRTECAGCEFRGVCKGYFKRSRSDYDCRGMISILKTLKGAAAELRENVAAASAASGR